MYSCSMYCYIVWFAAPTTTLILVVVYKTVAKLCYEKYHLYFWNFVLLLR